MSDLRNPGPGRPYREALADAGYFVMASSLGLVGYESKMIALTSALTAALARLWRSADTRVLEFPPVIPRSVLERSGYLGTFPHLVGAIAHFDGGEEQRRSLQEDIRSSGSWFHLLAQSEYLLTPAACYHVYPSYSGKLDDDGAMVEVASFCFRHEPSEKSDRFVSFRQLEFVRIGSAAAVDSWFREGQARLRKVADELQLPGSVVPATDPFFGPAERILAAVQAAAGAKYELQVPTGTADGTAVASCNAHADHFGERFGIADSAGLVAHSSCLAFGVERLALAVLWTHGSNAADWPEGVRGFLGWGPDEPAA